MPKYIEVTPEIKSRIEQSLGEEVDTTNFRVYEARMISTEPISRNKGFYAGARVSRPTLGEMAEFVNGQGNVLPLQIMHNKEVLPVGRVFFAKLLDMPNGETELRAQFYIPQDNGGPKSQLIADIESGLVSEVSVGLLTKHAYCSECDFDYFGPDADFMNIMTQTCDNDHTIGVDGTHLRLVGLDAFAELSLVGRGAAKDAKIFSRAKTRLSEDTVNRLAASGVPAEAHVLTASYSMDDKCSKPTSKEGETDMSGLEAKLADVSSELGEKKAELSQATKTIEGLNSEKEELNAKLTEANAKIEELEANQGEETTELKASFDELKETVDEASAKLAEHVKAALVASGDKEAEIPEDLGAMLALIEEKGLKLHQIVGSEPTSGGHKSDVEAKDDLLEQRRKANFKVR